MKLIIDIPEGLKQTIDNGFTSQVIVDKLWYATKNGIPLDKIRAEIEDHRSKTEYIDQYDLVGDCLDIIDKYRK